jgi:hypothetical protein
MTTHTGSNGGFGIHWITDARRAAIRTRDSHQCVYCLAPAGDIDHVTGRHSNETGNLVVACRACNAAKGALSIAALSTYLTARGINPAAAYARVRTATATPVAVGRPTSATTKRLVTRAINAAVSA